MKHLHLIVAILMLLACRIPFIAFAQGSSSFDAPTQTALTALRTDAAGMVGSLADDKGINQRSVDRVICGPAGAATAADEQRHDCQDQGRAVGLGPDGPHLARVDQNYFASQH